SDDVTPPGMVVANFQIILSSHTRLAAIYLDRDCYSDLLMDRQKRWLVAGTVTYTVCLSIFISLAVVIWRQGSFGFDATVRNTIHSWQSPPLTLAMQIITQLGSAWFLGVLGVVIILRLLSVGRRRAAVMFGIAAVGGELLDQVLKDLFHRPRPQV